MSITNNNPRCKKVIGQLGDKWTMLIIDHLSDSRLRFSDLVKKLNVNTATLTSRLKKLEAQGLIIRNEQSRSDVSYELSDLGKKVIPVLKEIERFSTYKNQTTKGEN